MGGGPPLVLLHGVLADSRMWRRQLGALSAEFTVVAWDAPGCVRSSDPPERFGLSDYADCLAAFIDALGLARPHVVGLSWGEGSLWSSIGESRRSHGRWYWLPPTLGGPVLCPPTL